MRYHHVSIFGPGPRVPLDREQQAVFRAKLKLARRPGRLTIAAAEIGRVMLNMMGADGRLDPMLDTIAEKARVCRSTVQRALDQLKALGFLDWDAAACSGLRRHPADLECLRADGAQSRCSFCACRHFKGL